MKARPKTRVLKMALIGTQRVGKTSLLTKLHFGTFEKNTIATVGASFVLHKFVINGEEVSYQIWDTAGQERYRSLAPIYYRDASCAIAVFDLSTPESFDEMKIYINEFITHCKDYCHIAIIGNKSDIYNPSPNFDLDKAERWAKGEGYSFFKTSANTGEGVEEAFQHIAEIVNRHNTQPETSAVNINEQKKSSSCC